MNISFSGTLLRFVNFQKTVQLDAATVGEALGAIAARFPQAKAVIYDGDGRVRHIHQIFLNGEQLAPTELDRRVDASDRMELLTAIAGG